MSTTPPPSTSGHTSRAKDPAIVHESQKVIGVIQTTAWLIALALVVWGIISWVSSARAKAKAVELERARTDPPAATSTEVVEALVLRYQGITPCSTMINYRAKVRWGERRPMRIKFSGVDTPVDFPGEGAFKAPAGVTFGTNFFTSLDPTNLHFKVQVYEKITVRK